MNLTDILLLLVLMDLMGKIKQDFDVVLLDLFFLSFLVISRITKHDMALAFETTEDIPSHCSHRRNSSDSIPLTYTRLAHLGMILYCHTVRHLLQ